MTDRTSLHAEIFTPSNMHHKWCYLELRNKAAFSFAAVSTKRSHKRSTTKNSSAAEAMFSQILEPPSTKKMNPYCAPIRAQTNGSMLRSNRVRARGLRRRGFGSEQHGDIEARGEEDAVVVIGLRLSSLKRNLQRV